MEEERVENQWYAVRCVFQTPQNGGFSYEEGVTLWRADGFDEAIAMAEEEAVEYAADVSDGTSQTEYIGLAQSYWLAEEPGHGAEVFSLISDSQLADDDYVTQFFASGHEHQQQD